MNVMRAISGSVKLGKGLFVGKALFVGRALCGGVLSSIVALAAIPAMAEQFVSIGTGGVTGVYYPTGGAASRSWRGVKRG